MCSSDFCCKTIRNKLVIGTKPYPVGRNIGQGLGKITGTSWNSKHFSEIGILFWYFCPLGEYRG